MGNEYERSSWAPVNGKAPYWANLLIWMLSHGVLFNVVGTMVLVVLALMYMGLMTNPTVERHERLMEKFAEQHITQTRGIESIVINQATLMKNGERNFQAGLANCQVNARIAQSPEATKICEHLARTGRAD